MGRSPLSRDEALYAQRRMKIGEPVVDIAGSLGLLRQDLYRSVKRALAKQKVRCKACGSLVEPNTIKRGDCIGCQRRKRAKRVQR